MISLWGFIAYLLLYLSVISGTLMSSPKLRRRYVKIAGSRAHEVLSLAALFATILHGVAGVPPFRDRTILTWLLVVPANSYGIGLAVGVVSLYALALVTASFYLRRRFGTPLWRWIHALAYPAFALAVWHSLAAGADAWLAAIQVFYLITFGSSVVLGALRLEDGLTRRLIAARKIASRR